MDTKEFRDWSKQLADWSADYRSDIASMPVRSQARPGKTLEELPPLPPQDAEDFATIFEDFKELVPPGLTNWQHPRCFAYFPANSSLASVLAEQLTAAIGANCMLWQTSPVATEMEMRMMQWLAHMCGVPANWQGVIQESASSASLAAVVTARERILDWQGLEQGLAGNPPLRFYGSMHCHSSIAKALAIAGIGKGNLVTVATDSTGGMDADALRKAVQEDRAKGMLPTGVTAVVGATSIGVSDNVRDVGAVCQEEKLYCHVDAAWAGSATICEEHRHLIDGLELADSYVFNPHKWLGVNFDFSAHFLKDAPSLVKSLATNPAYLQTQHATGMPDFCHWSVTLGRRFRALKLWFVIRNYGVKGLQAMIRNHVNWVAKAARTIDSHPDFELLSGPNLALAAFRHNPADFASPDKLDEHNASLLEAINSDGFTYLTQTEVDGAYALRLQVGHPSTTEKDVEDTMERIISIATDLAKITK